MADQTIKSTEGQQPTVTTKARYAGGTDASKTVQAVAPQVDTAFTIRTKSASSTSRWFNMLVYGDYGTGKTHLAGTAADVEEFKDVLLADAEGGDATIEDKDIDRVRITQYKQFSKLTDFLRIHAQLRDSNDPQAFEKMVQLQARFMHVTGEQVREEIGVRKYRTVIIDSLTEVQKFCMYQLLGITLGKQALDIEPDSPGFKEWGQSLEMILLLVRTFRALPMNLIICCSQQYDQDETKKFHYSANLPGKLATQVNGFFDNVGFLVAAPAVDGGDMQRRLYLEPGKTFKAKNRIKNWHGQYVDDPSISKILQLGK